MKQQSSLLTENLSELKSEGLIKEWGDKDKTPKQKLFVVKKL